MSHEASDRHHRAPGGASAPPLTCTGTVSEGGLELLGCLVLPGSSRRICVITSWRYATIALPLEASGRIPVHGRQHHQEHHSGPAAAIARRDGALITHPHNRKDNPSGQPTDHIPELA